MDDRVKDRQIVLRLPREEFELLQQEAEDRSKQIGIDVTVSAVVRSIILAHNRKNAGAKRTAVNRLAKKGDRDR